jgi:hypothetical protein
LWPQKGGFDQNLVPIKDDVQWRLLGHVRTFLSLLLIYMREHSEREEPHQELSTSGDPLYLQMPPEPAPPIDASFKKKPNQLAVMNLNLPGINKSAH